MRHRNALSLPALAITGLMLIPAPDAAAHDATYAAFAGHPAQRFAYRRAVMPHWLRQHRDFVRWYSLNVGRYAVDAGWRRLYRRYEADYYYHRHYKHRDKSWRRDKRDKRHGKRHRRQHD